MVDRVVKIVYLITELNIGGAEKCLYELVKRVDKDRFQPTVISIKSSGRVGEWIESEGVEVISLGMESKFSPLGLLKLRYILKKSGFDILHSFLFHANIFGRVAAFLWDVPITISSIRVCEKEREHHLRLDKLTEELVDVEVCVSKNVRRFTIENAKLKPEKLRVIHNGIDLSKLKNLKGNVRKELGIGNKEFLIASVGRLTKQKGFKYLVKAAEKVLKLEKNVNFCIVGEGELKENLFELVRELGLSDCVHLLGFREDVLSIINKSDLFVLPSLWEGLPNVLLESAALGVPIVSTDAGGCSEIIEDGENGILVSPGDEDDLANAILEMIRESEIRKKFAEKGKRIIKNKFSIEKMVNAYKDLYEELLGKR